MAESFKSTDFTNVVIKLGLIKEGNEAPVYRHVPCSCLDLTDPNGTQAVEVLKKRAVLMFGGKNDDVKNVNLTIHRVELTFNDTDDDKVLILSDDDIISALKEYVKVGRVKILAKVSSASSSEGKAETKASTSSSFPEAVPYVSVSTQTFVNGERIPSVVPNQTEDSEFIPPPMQENPNFVPPSVHVFHGPTFSSFNTVNSQSPPPAHEIPGFAAFNMFNNDSSRSGAPPEFASSIANIINFAVKSATSAANSSAVKDALNAAAKAAADMEEQAKKAASEAVNHAKTAQTVVAEETNNAVRNSQRCARQAARCARQATRRSARSVAASVAGAVAPEQLSVNDGIAASECATTQPPTSSEVVRPETEVNTTTAPERPFIHGRHTCDGCLTTPIYGKRFNSLSVKDFDLCENCMSTYTGRDTFEEAQLERDAPFQDRWHMRHARFGAGRRCGRGRWQQRHQNNIIPPPAPQHPPNEPPHAKQADMALSAIGDLALEEAIRRSLEDQSVKQDSKESKSVETSTALNTNSNEFSIVVETVDEKDEEIASPPCDAKSVEPSVTVDSERDIPVVSNEQSDVPSENKASETSTEETNHPTTSSGDFFSFASTAEGDTAALLGATLDKMAEAIDGLNWDLNNSSDTPLNENNADDEDSDEGAQILDGDDDIDDDESSGSDGWHVVNEGEQIARAAQALGSALFSSGMERSSEHMSTLSNSIGTGLSSATGLSTLETVPSAVRSLTEDTKVADVQLDRWAHQLFQLHELGFFNDAVNVDVLETLNAANIGVDSDDEVSVQQVVNVLLK